MCWWICKHLSIYQRMALCENKDKNNMNVEQKVEAGYTFNRQARTALHKQTFPALDGFIATFANLIIINIGNQKQLIEFPFTLKTKIVPCSFLG